MTSIKKMTTSLVCIATLVILTLIESSNGQGDNLKNSIANNALCTQKLGECDIYKAKANDQSNIMKVCCGVRGWARCSQRAIDSYCTSTNWETVSATAPDLTSDRCRDYQFWTPECIYNNYQYEVIGAAAGAIGIVIILIVICCCCCCRSKK